MKGIVFTEFLEMVEHQFGLAMTDRIMSEAELPSGRAYTPLGTYAHEELLRMVRALSVSTGTPMHDIMMAFGEHLFGRFFMFSSRLFEGINTSFEFLARVQDYVHVEVYKLYPEAELPTFRHQLLSPTQLVMMYESHRPFADLAEGLLLGCTKHFRESVRITRENLPGKGMIRVRFTLTHDDCQG